MSAPEKTEIKKALEGLESDLHSETEVHAAPPRETPPRWNFLDAFTTLQVGQAPPAPLLPFLSPKPPETSVERFMTECAFAQRNARSMVRQNREIMARSGPKLF